MTEPVLFETSGGVATITLNRPEALNALTLAMKEALLDVVRSVHEDAAVRAVVLTGAGRAFCAGQDLREHSGLLDAGAASPLSTVAQHFNPIVTMLTGMAKPVIAAVNGTAAGAGLGLACACDFRIGAAGSRMTTAFTGIGLTADSGLTWTLPRLVGAARATALLMLAEPFTAEQAQEMGLLTAVVPAEQVLPAAQEIAARLAAGPTVAYGLLKGALLAAATSPLADALAREDRDQAVAGRTSDHSNAVSSFLAKTPPVFQGH